MLAKQYNSAVIQLLFMEKFEDVKSFYKFVTLKMSPSTIKYPTSSLLPKENRQ